MDASLPTLAVGIQFANFQQLKLACPLPHVFFTVLAVENQGIRGVHAVDPSRR